MKELQALKHAATLEEKAAMIQQFYERVIFHESGIMYSLMKIDGDRIRPFAPEDFEGRDTFDYSQWRIKPEGHWTMLDNENSITTSGIYLASQAYRYEATGDAAALEQAGKAFRSLELIYAFGVQDGRPGWMGKPYGFRLSDQTSGDQYLDALWGLFAYHRVAPEPHKRKIEQMVIGFADYWRSIDYKIVYITTFWDNKLEQHAYNMIFLAINSAAYAFSHDPVHLREAEFFIGRALWHEETNVDKWRNKHLAGNDADGKFNRLVAGYLQPGEHLCWESTIHSKFVAVGAEIVYLTNRELMGDKLEPTLVKWWSTWSLGIDDDLLPYYYFIVNALTGEWRPAPRTPRLPRDQWPLGHPFISYASQSRWMEPLCRFLFTSVLAASYGTSVKDEAQALALRIMDSVDDVRMRWQYDPDGNQIIPELDYMNNVLSSEMPATFLATFWRGRLERLW
ncbi:MAG: hypothetical protein J7639_19885 [Paenibacillaceae bacterium]|nr:hypothetical protein [Paenibacillaceae bacterium]